MHLLYYIDSTKNSTESNTMNDSRTIISHLYSNKENGQWIIQTNDEHQKGVAELAATFAKQLGLPTWGYFLGILHDKGKERHAFQQYIRTVNGLPITDTKHYENHHHAFVGGLIAHKLLGKNIIHLLCNQIISHHTGLHDYMDVESILQDQQIPKEIDWENTHVDAAQLNKELNSLNLCSNDLIHFHHIARLLFSCLVDADRLDTEHFMDIKSWQKRGCSSELAELLPKLEKHLHQLQAYATESHVNHIRKKVMELCEKRAEGEKGFYSLTVPTGGGKTLSSLLWAMKHAVHHKMSRIIIAIPYTSIIVQTARILKTIFGEDNVLEHHSNFNPDEIKDEEKRERAILATENWDYPIIVTTNVQLFESMFSNKPSSCRKLHNIVNSVIILDEVQTLPTDFLQPIVDALKAYQKMFGTSVLFTTASQPVLTGEIEASNPKENLKGIEHITEIIPPELKLHEKLRRVKLEIDNTGKTYDEIAATLSEHKKVLCIVNTRKDAKELFDRLPNEGIKLHLSRMMCPAHISETIERIKTLLKDDDQPIIRVIATQLVEAGVDIDFPIVFRQETGLDSILQAAGRCNREGKYNMGHTFVFSLSAENRIPFGSMAKANNARLNLPVNSDWFAPDTMNEYFLQRYSRETTFDKKDIKHYLYKYNELCFDKAAMLFKLIDDNNQNIIVNWKDSTKWIAQLKEYGCTYPLMKKLAQYTVSIHQSDFNRLNEYGAINEIIEGIYVLSDSAQYDNDTGVSLENHWMDETLMV